MTRDQFVKHFCVDQMFSVSQNAAPFRREPRSPYLRMGSGVETIPRVEATQSGDLAPGATRRRAENEGGAVPEAEGRGTILHNVQVMAD
jgi:hypothetical protein